MLGSSLGIVRSINSLAILVWLISRPSKVLNCGTVIASNTS